MKENCRLVNLIFNMVFERCMFWKISSLIQSYGLKHQCRFRKGHIKPYFKLAMVSNVKVLSHNLLSAKRFAYNFNLAASKHGSSDWSIRNVSIKTDSDLVC